MILQSSDELDHRLVNLLILVCSLSTRSILIIHSQPSEQKVAGSIATKQFTCTLSIYLY